jgi:hypothetical protein
MDDNELPKEILRTNPGGQQGRGRPKSRWTDGVKKDARKLCCRNGRAAVQERNRWRHSLRRPRPTQGCGAFCDDEFLAKDGRERPKHVGDLPHICILLYLIIVQRLVYMVTYLPVRKVDGVKNPAHVYAL